MRCEPSLACSVDRRSVHARARDDCAVRENGGRSSPDARSRFIRLQCSLSHLPIRVLPVSVAFTAYGTRGRLPSSTHFLALLRFSFPAWLPLALSRRPSAPDQDVVGTAGPLLAQELNLPKRSHSHCAWGSQKASPFMLSHRQVLRMIASKAVPSPRSAAGLSTRLENNAYASGDLSPLFPYSSPGGHRIAMTFDRNHTPPRTPSVRLF